MCWFVTLGVPAKASDALERLRRAHRGLGYCAIAATPTTHLFAPGSTCLELTTGGCSCALYCWPRIEPDADVARDRARFAARGWSEAKIARALDDQVRRGPRHDPHQESREAFRHFLVAVVQEAGPVQLFAHFYRGNQHEEAVPVPAVAMTACADIVASGFPEDTLVTVRP